MPKRYRKKKFPRFGYGEIKDNFIEDLLMMLGAGMDILSALKAIKSEFKSRPLVKFLADLEEEIEAGASIYEAFSDRNLLDSQALSLIKLGEKSGRLVENLEVIALSQRKNRSFRSKINSAVMYPAFVLTVAAVVGLVITWFILPKISSVFSSMDIPLPLITKIMIALGDFIGQYGYIAIPVFLVICIATAYILFFLKWTKFIGQYILLVMPVFGKLVRQAELSRFGFILGTLLDAGLPLLEAMESLADSADIYAYKKFYRHLVIKIEEGRPLREIFKNYRRINFLFPPTVLQLISGGEQAGGLSVILKKIGDSYEQKMDTTSKNMTVLLEPMLLFVVFLAVLAVAVAVIMPIYSLVGMFSG